MAGLDPRSPAQPPRRIAVFRALHLGDLLLAVPALRWLRAGFPDAEMTFVGLPWAASFVGRFRHYLDRFVEFGGYPGIEEVEVSPERSARFLAEQRAYGYDLVIQMHGSGRTSNPCVLAFGGRVTVGYYEEEAPPGLTLGAPYPADEPEIVRNIGLAGMLGCPDRGLRLEFPLSDGDRTEATALLRPLARPDRPRIGLHAGASRPSRRWPAERFAALGDELVRRFGAQIVLTGGPAEMATVREVADRMAAQPLILAGETSLGGLAALIAELDLFVSNDTGPAHLACAVDTPSVTIFGPGDHARWAPLDGDRHPTVRRPVECSPCAYGECPIDHRCLRRVYPEMILAVVERLLSKGAVACGA
jgi:ADP-heptose:LPS heptosyltransferase